MSLMRLVPRRQFAHDRLARFQTTKQTRIRMISVSATESNAMDAPIRKVASLNKMAASTDNVVITESASKRLNEIQEQDGSLRIEVEAGGCHGYQINLKLTDEYFDEDMYVHSFL